jgi:hypothetical protein
VRRRRFEHGSRLNERSRERASASAAATRWRSPSRSGALLAAVLLTAPSGIPGAPSISQAAALGLRGPQATAPAPDRSAPGGRLNRSLEGVYFPNWWPRFGWRAIGQREDRIDGRLALTVYYANGRGQLAYTIVSAPALLAPPAALAQVNGIEFRTFAISGREVVTWRRAGHTCVLSGHSVTASEMRQLAAWKVQGVDE